MADSREHEPEPKNFEPKTPVKLDAPKDDPYTPEELAKYDGKSHASSFLDLVHTEWSVSIGQFEVG